MEPFIKVDDDTGRVAGVTADTATHVSVEAYQDALRRVTELENQNQRLHAKLTRQIQNKRNWRTKAQQAVGGPVPQRSRPKREVVARRDGYYAVSLVDLDAENERQALTEALEYLWEECPPGTRLRRIADPGTGFWVAEIETKMSSGSWPVERDEGA